MLELAIHIITLVLALCVLGVVIAIGAKLRLLSGSSASNHDAV